MIIIRRNPYFFLFSVILLVTASAVNGQNPPPSEPTAPAWYAEALNLYNQKNYEGSLEKIRAVFDADSGSFHLRILAAASHYRLGNTDSALAHLRAAEKADPGRFETHLLAASVYRKSGKATQAIASVRKAAALGASAEVVKTESARIYYEAGQYAKARAEAEAVLATDAKHAEAMYIDALFFARQGKWESAEFRLRQILHMGGLPSVYQADFYNNLGYALDKMSSGAQSSGKAEDAVSLKKEAAAFYEKALKIQPAHPQAKANLSRINASSD